MNIGRRDLTTVLVNVLYPLLMLIKAVGGDTDDLNIALLEILGPTSHLTEFSSANRREISRVREKYSLCRFDVRIRDIRLR